MNKLFRVIPGGAVLGLLAGLVLQLVEDWSVLTLPVRALGEGLRELSLSGVGGNLAAWGLVLLLSALPLILLLPRKGRWRGDEDWLLALTFPLLLAGLVLLVNPTLLSWADRTRFPVAVVLCLLSVFRVLAYPALLAWGILKVLRRLEGAPREELARAFSLLLLLCAGLAACAAGFALAAQGLQRCQEVLQGNASSLPDWWAGVLGGGDGPKRVLSLAVIWAVCALEAAPGLLSAATMVWGAELARALGREDFDREGVELCGRTAQACRILAQATVALAVSANLLQLLLLPLLHAVRPALSLPLVSLALSAGLMLLCRCLQRGRELQEDNDSII